MTIQERIIEILKDRNHTNPMCRDILLDHLYDQDENITDREMRLIVAEMVTQGGIPIGTNTRGYFMVATVEDFQAADGEMKAKEEAIRERRTALFKAFQASVGVEYPETGQLGLFDTKSA